MREQGRFEEAEERGREGVWITFNASSTPSHITESRANSAWRDHPSTRGTFAPYGSPRSGVRKVFSVAPIWGQKMRQGVDLYWLTEANHRGGGGK